MWLCPSSLMHPGYGAQAVQASGLTPCPFGGRCVDRLAPILPDDVGHGDVGSTGWGVGLR
jgi:hypothetical protein